MKVFCKFSVVILAVLLLFWGSGCEKNSRQPEKLPNVDTTSQAASVLTPEEAAAQALEVYNAAFGKRTRGDGEQVAVRDVIDSRPRTRGEDSLDAKGFYVVNMQADKGFVIVARRKEEGAPLAILENGYFDPHKPIENSNFGYMMNLITDYANRNWDDDDDPGHDHPSPGKPIKNPEIDTGFEEIVTLPWTPIEEKGPIVKAAWGQRAPFNWYCKTREGKEAPAGCVAIAMCHIMSVHRHPSNYPWNEMIKITNRNYKCYQSASDKLARLMHEVGLRLRMKYTTNASTAFDGATTLVFWSYGYVTGNPESYSYEAIKSESLQEAPVYMSGSGNERYGHAWVVDGYQVQESKTVIMKFGGPYKVLSSQRVNYVHCNMGEDGNGTGFYTGNLFWKYSKDLMIIRGIRKK